MKKNIGLTIISVLLIVFGVFLFIGMTPLDVIGETKDKVVCSVSLDKDSLFGATCSIPSTCGIGDVFSTQGIFDYTNTLQMWSEGKTIKSVKFDASVFGTNSAVTISGCVSQTTNTIDFVLLGDEGQQLATMTKNIRGTA